MQGKEILISHLLELGARLDIPDQHTKRTALQSAAGQGHLDTVSQLIKCGADVNDPPASAEGGVTALEAAAEGNHLNIVDLLLERGAGSDTVGLRRVLQVAAANGRVDLVHILLDRYTEFDDKNLRKILARAAGGGHVEPVLLLLERKDIGSHDIAKQEVFEAAAANGHLELVRFLLERFPRAGDGFTLEGDMI